MDYRTDRRIQWTNLPVNYMDKTVLKADWFHYCNIVQTIKGISVDCNHSF